MSRVMPISADRGRRMVESLAILWLLCLCDLCFTLWAHAFTSFHELNPLARMMLHADLVGLLIGFKVGLTGLATAIFWRLRWYGQAEVAAWMMVSVYLMVLMRWSDYTVAAAML